MAYEIPIEAMQALGRKLANVRIKNNLHQEDLITRSNGNLSMGTIIAIENAKYNVKLAQLLSYVDALGCELTVQPKE